MLKSSKQTNWRKRLHFHALKETSGWPARWIQRVLGAGSATCMKSCQIIGGDLRARLMVPKDLKVMGLVINFPFKGNLEPAFGFLGGTWAVKFQNLLLSKPKHGLTTGIKDLSLTNAARDPTESRGESTPFGAGTKGLCSRIGPSFQRCPQAGQTANLSLTRN